MFRHRVLSGYRRLFRARRNLFGGDERAMKESRIAIKAEFVKNRTITETQHMEACLTGVDEAEDMLLHQIMRGERNKRGNYAIKVDPNHVQPTSSTTLMNPNNMATMEPITNETTLEPGIPKVQVTKVGASGVTPTATTCTIKRS